MYMIAFFFFFFNDTATTEIYTYDTLFPYTTLFRSADGSAVLNVPSILTAIGSPSEIIRRSFLANSRAIASAKLRATNSSIRSEEHTSELQSLMRISYAVFCLKKKKHENRNINKAIITDQLRYLTSTVKQ